MTESAGEPFWLNAVRHIGTGLVRPECVLALSGGRLLTADWRGGAMLIHPDNRQRLIAAWGDVPDGGLKPNGIAVTRDGAILLAHLDDAAGGVWRMDADGRAAPWLLSVDGIDLPPTNFVHVDAKDRVWITVSTRLVPRTLARSQHVADGFIVLVADGRARIVAEGIGFTNEAKVGPSGEWLYVNETFGRRIIRYPITAGPSLGPPEIVSEFGAGVFPDGLEFDTDGGIWITSVFSNRLIRIAADGAPTVMLEDNDPNYLADIERAFVSDTLKLRPPEIVPSSVLRNISSVAFGGQDRRRLFLGCLQGDAVAFWDTPTAGVRPTHWDWFGPLPANYTNGR